MLYLDKISRTEQRYKFYTRYEEYVTDRNITHTTHDDLKLVSQTKSSINSYLQTVKPLSNDIHMEVGTDKCAKITLKTKISSIKFNSLHTST